MDDDGIKHHPDMDPVSQYGGTIVNIHEFIRFCDDNLYNTNDSTNKVYDMSIGVAKKNIFTRYD
jgi:hypothetical protein